MTRIENENKKPDQLDEMQDEIEHLKKQLKHKQSKKFFNCSSCAVLLIIIFVALGAVFASIMAKSGLWQLPFFTDYFYRQPEPVHLVKDSNFTENDLVNRLQQIALAEAKIQGKVSNLSINFEISEEELTAFLRNQVKKNEALAKKIEFWQIAIEADSAQLFLKANSSKNLILILDFIPSIKDGKLSLGVKNFKIGNLTLPKFFGNLLVENIGANTFNSLLNSFGSIGKIEQVVLADHKIKIKILINNLNL